jgi:predicted nucleotidyltransferase/DNA-binding transcriptional ArsR family regulator
MPVDLSRPLSVVTPTLDGDVLAVLAGAEQAFSAREVHRLAGRASEQGVRKALARLERQGIVTAEPAGAARLYRLNRAHLAAPHIEALADLRETLVERLRTLVAAWILAPAYAAVFGSFARHQAGLESDLDLFVARPPEIDEDDPQWRRQVDALTAVATAWTGNDARVLEYGVEEVRARVSLGDEVLDAIRREGIDLAGMGAVIRRQRRVSA